MNPSLDAFLRWAPRLLCLVFAAFISLFALDAFDPGRGLVIAAPAWTTGALFLMTPAVRPDVSS